MMILPVADAQAKLSRLIELAVTAMREAGRL
jgi:hypothetical protein